MFRVAAVLILQQALAAPQVGAGGRDPVPAPTATSAVAVRAIRAPAIDGRDGDAVWQSTPPITQFLEWQPTEGKAPRFRTEARIAYDASNLYVFVRAYDPHPDSLIRPLERRDNIPPSDMIIVILDSYHDRRTGYEFGVTAAGVKYDAAVYDDGNEDRAWDAVWDVATRVDSLGWTAEYRIPMSQMRYGTERAHTFGIVIDRDIYRYSERVSWPMLSPAKAGMVSQLGELTGLDGLETPRRIEAAPYLVTRNASTTSDNGFARASFGTIGADLKFRVASNLTLDATANPDFGQVEADPAVFNLTAYETFYDERRPFFVAGQGQFRFDVNCNQVNCGGEGLYYSRRIGRTPELWGRYGDGATATPTTILGAGKLTGRLASGLTIGVLDAVTERAAVGAGRDTTVEPATNYAVVRLQQDLRNGGSTFGAMVTAVDRGMDVFASPYLARDAYVGAMDFRHRFLRNTYQVSGSLDASRVTGSPAAMLGILTDAVHYYQRPDAGLPLDPTRTALSGDAEELKFAKIAGAHLNFETSYQRRSPGFEINDLGYLQRADQQAWSTWVGFFDRAVRPLYQSFQWNVNWWQYWTTAGLPLERALNTNAHMTLLSHWTLNAGGTVGQLGGTYDDRAARGGPAVRYDPYVAPWIYLTGDDRRGLVPMLSINYAAGDAGHSHSLDFGPEVDFKAASRFSGSVATHFSRSINDIQWFGLYPDSGGVDQGTFAHLAQTTSSVTLRLNYTFTPTVSLQVYAQPFMTKGTYSNVRQLSATPRAAAYVDRYAPFVPGESFAAVPMGFNYKAFQSNVVFRWEYRPGSTLFLVWSQGRQAYAGAEGTSGYTGDLRDLFAVHPLDTFLVKVSYWLNR